MCSKPSRFLKQVYPLFDVAFIHLPCRLFLFSQHWTCICGCLTPLRPVAIESRERFSGFKARCVKCHTSGLRIARHKCSPPWFYSQSCCFVSVNLSLHAVSCRHNHHRDLTVFWCRGFSWATENTVCWNVLLHVVSLTQVSLVGEVVLDSWVQRVVSRHVSIPLLSGRLSERIWHVLILGSAHWGRLNCKHGQTLST